MQDIAEQKKLLRKKMLALLKSLPESERAKLSQAICDKLLANPDVQNARVIVAYAPMGKEVNIAPACEKLEKLGKKVVVVAAAKAEIIVDIPLENIDVVLVPGLAFDRDGNRLGKGFGYYDRFLKKLPPRTVTIGVGFEFQVIGEVSHNEKDVQVKKVLAPEMQHC